MTIAAGGRFGRAAAGAGAGLAALVTFVIALVVLSGCLGRCGDLAWLSPIGAAALSVISLLAARQMGIRMD
jgi:hypothetical protein